MTEHGIRAAIYQRDGLADLINEDEFLLLILDACRWDALQHYLGTEITMALSPAPLTVRWLWSCWPGTYDLTYVAANPHLAPAPRAEGVVAYDGTEHFDELVYLGDEGWDDDLGTYPPAPIRDATIEADADRMVTHFIQPHVPFIGEHRLGDLKYGERGYEVLEDVDQADVLRAYRDNLDRVWTEGVKPLLDRYEDRRIVVSADHGELLGESGKYGHGAYATPVLFVPWVEYPAGSSAPELADIEWSASLDRTLRAICGAMDIDPNVG